MSDTSSDARVESEEPTLDELEEDWQQELEDIDLLGFGRDYRMDRRQAQVAAGSTKGWKLEDATDGSGPIAIRRTFSFYHFRQAFAFMAHAAMIFEKHEHHPDWRNRFHKVHVRLMTYGVGGLSAKDFVVAMELDEFAEFFHVPHGDGGAGENSLTVKG